MLASSTRESDSTSATPGARKVKLRDGGQAEIVIGAGVRISHGTAERDTILIQALGKQEYVAIAPERNQVLDTSDDAWRFLGWTVPDATSGEIARWPVESFGAIPGKVSDSPSP
jgi:hypothetical protein